MFWIYIRIAFQSLSANKKISMINITGFAFAISICLAIALFLIKENSFDQHHENSDQIVRLIDNKNNSSLIDYRIKDILLANFPEIENGCLVQRVGHPIEVKKGDEGFYLDDIMSVDNNFFEVFSIPFTTGGSTSPFININSAVITESIAKTLFGTDSPLGKDILIQGITPVTITGIINDFPDNSSIFAGILVNAENENFKFNRWIGNSQDSSSYRWPFQVIIVQRQIKYVKHKNPGFNESFLIRLDVPAIQKNDYKKALALLEELRMSPYIKSFTVTSGVPGEIRLSMGSNMKNSDKNISLPCLLVDSVFLRTFEMTVIKGRNLKPGDMGKVCMLNEAAYNHFEFENLENKRINNYGGFDIIGVVNDFHYSSLHKTIGPVCIMFTPNFLPTAINIRFEKDGAGQRICEMGILSFCNCRTNNLLCYAQMA